MQHNWQSGDTSMANQSIIETRRYQMFPILLPEEIERVRRFGEMRSFAAGEALARVGEPAPGLMIILSGKVDVFQTHGGQRSLIVTHETGSFMGELAQLGGRPALVDAIATRAGRGHRHSRRRSCAPCSSPRPSSASASCAR